MEIADEKLASLKTVNHVTYALYALSLFSGVTAIVAIVLNYIKRDDARGTWIESHFSWQIRTFWYALAWALLVVLISLPLTLVIIGFGTWALGMFILGLWAIYRIARGWLRLNAHQPMRA